MLKVKESVRHQATLTEGIYAPGPSLDTGTYLFNPWRQPCRVDVISPILPLGEVRL